MSDKEIIVTGYPKSGNTWLARLLGDALNSPVTGYKNATPIAQEGKDRTGSYLIRQLHLIPDYKESGQFISDNSKFLFVSCYDNEKIIVIVRDPRDVCVSCYHYWKMKSISQTIRAMYNAEWPIVAAGPYHLFMELWSTCPLPVVFIKYEDLLRDTELYLDKLLSKLNIKPVQNLTEVIDRQSLSSRRKGFEELQNQGKHYHPYGTGTQLTNLRKGIEGDWRNHFTKSDTEFFRSLFNPTMQLLGYEWHDISE